VVHALGATAPTGETYARAFAEARAGLPGAGQYEVEARREAALARFVRHGIPTTKVEAWKFTNLAPLTRAVFRPAGATAPRPQLSPAAIAPWRLAEPALCAVFVGGRFRPDLSVLAGLPAGVRVSSLADDLALGGAALLLGEDSGDRGEALVALNAAFAADGAHIVIAPGVRLEQPLQILFLAPGEGDAGVVHPRHAILLGAGAEATVVETYAGVPPGALGAPNPEVRAASPPGAISWTNAVTRISLGEGARLAHAKLQAEDAAAFHVAATEVRLARGAAFEGFALSLGAALSRNEIDVRLQGPEAACRLAGVTLLRGRQHGDATTRVEHATVRATSQQEFRAVVDGEAHAVFQGRIRVAPDAQKTDARLTTRSLLLSESAQADAKPELEILADDVQCSHGAAIGDLDRAALFYLRARGISEAVARAMLIEAFAGESLAAIASEPVRDHMTAAFARWLEAGHA
jgi:Fe-S cluster assembly protein SufD